MTALADAIVLVTPRSFGLDDPQIRDELEAAVGEVRYSTHGRPLSADELSAEIADVDGLIAGLDDIDATVFASAPRLRVVARYGVGTSNVDLHAAAEHGVIVTNTPGANAQAVAELAVGLMFALARSITLADRATHAGGWPSMKGIEMRGRTVGILGYGRIGRVVAQLATAVGCEVMAYDPYVDLHATSQTGVCLASHDEVVGRADFLTLHLPVTSESRDLVDRDFLQRMQRGAFLVNTARGELIVEEALGPALDAGQLRGAALDTLRQEPPPTNHPLLSRPDVIVTPHIGAHTAEAGRSMGRMAVHELLAVLSGDTPRFDVERPSGISA